MPACPHAPIPPFPHSRIPAFPHARIPIPCTQVMKPELIFLDEPTSGLDSFAAQSVCRKLVELGSTRGCNILCTIHQPASEVFHTFNKVRCICTHAHMHMCTRLHTSAHTPAHTPAHAHVRR